MLPSLFTATAVLARPRGPCSRVTPPATVHVYAYELDRSFPVPTTRAASVTSVAVLEPGSWAPMSARPPVAVHENAAPPLGESLTPTTWPLSLTAVAELFTLNRVRAPMSTVPPALVHEYACSLEPFEAVPTTCPALLMSL